LSRLSVQETHKTSNGLHLFIVRVASVKVEGSPSALRNSNNRVFEILRVHEEVRDDIVLWPKWKWSV
jgi:hypothetical protein